MHCNVGFGPNLVNLKGTGPGGGAGGLLEEGGESLRPGQGAGQEQLQDGLCQARLSFSFKTLGKRWRTL